MDGSGKPHFWDMNQPPKRWQLRLTSLKRATALFGPALAIPHPDETHQAGIVQFFEVAFELGWKTGSVQVRIIWKARNGLVRRRRGTSFSSPLPMDSLPMRIRGLTHSKNEIYWLTRTMNGGCGRH